MLGFLFRTLTAEPERGAKLFAAASDDARRREWYVEAGVPDTLDGRFAMLATIIALVLVRLEQAGGEQASVALTERFIEVMEAEHRELGIGDPTLGKTVRRLVGSLARRTTLWRSAVAGERDWDEATRQSLYKTSMAPAALAHGAAALKAFRAGLDNRSVDDLMQGKLK